MGAPFNYNESFYHRMPDRTTGETGSEEELRTIAFRLREIQRLLGLRIAQENRRLEDEGMEPVTESEFFRNSRPDEE